MLYSNGIFDSATCCTAQNHAITLVGYGKHGEVEAGELLLVHRGRSFRCGSCYVNGLLVCTK
jgi:hypothetical protein